jgi:hypothetical protein
MNLAPWASILTWIATGLSVLVAIVTVVALYARTQSSKEEKAALIIYQSTTQTTIATLNTRAAEANERATQAQSSLALAEQHSAEANAKAEGFRLDIARANERAAGANELAEKERLARLQLEARLADRVLTPDQERRITLACAKLKGMTVDFAVIGDTMEIARFSGGLLSALQKAGVPVNRINPMAGASAQGVLVGVKQDAPAVVAQAASALIAILRESVGGGVGPWAWQDLNFFGSGMVFQAEGAVPIGQAPLRIVVAAK